MENIPRKIQKLLLLYHKRLILTSGYLLKNIFKMIIFGEFLK